MTHPCEPGEGRHVILTNTNVSYGVINEERERGGEDADYEYNMVRVPEPHLASHPRPESVLTDSYGYVKPYEVPKHHRQAPAMDVPPAPLDGGEKGSDEALNEPIMPML